jgi:type II secretory pathway predicted ATPase ExeA
MYNSYFGFREKPFKLVPNPEYLFLSKTHEIALAHLTYATEQGEGFVVIIGEVGTGKTTLCRNYLESLDEDTNSAYIFNPHLDTKDLLVGIIHEYGLRTEEKNTKALLDILNEFLIKQNTVDRKVVLLIDEAQLLSIENLEMVRMLSNLETTKSKLLQIILVGQPELAAKLETYELRQLSQRISLNYHLTPLPREDTQAYIQHRIGIASQRQDKIFTPDACRLVYQYSGGIPRLINIACDRALLTAYSQNKTSVTKAVMQTAIEELSSTSKVSAPSPKRGLLMVVAGICALAVLAVGAYFVFLFLSSPPASPPAVAATEKAEPVPAAPQRHVFKVPAIGSAEQNPGKGQIPGKVDEEDLKPSETSKAPGPTSIAEAQQPSVSKSDDRTTPSVSKAGDRLQAMLVVMLRIKQPRFRSPRRPKTWPPPIWVHGLAGWTRSSPGRIRPPSCCPCGSNPDPMSTSYPLRWMTTAFSILPHGNTDCETTPSRAIGISSAGLICRPSSA